MKLIDILPEHIGRAKYNKNPEEIVRKAVKSGVDVNEEIEKGNNALHYKGIYDYIKVLVECGIDVNKKNDAGETPIELMAKRNDWADYEKLYVREHQTPEMRKGLRETLIKLAKENVYNTTVNIMLWDMGKLKEVDGQDEDGKTAMLIYAENKNWKAVNELRRQGWSRYQKDKEGNSVIKKYPKMKKSMKKFENYIKYNRYDRETSKKIEIDFTEEYGRIPGPRKLIKVLNETDSTYIEESKQLIERHKMHKLGIAMIRVVPMMMLWRKVATEKVYHPSRMKFEIPAQKKRNAGKN
jgi:hypothetical protein